MASYTYEYTSKTVSFHVQGLSYGDSVRFFVRYEPNPGWLYYDIAYTATSYYMDQVFNLPLANQAYAINVHVNGIELGTRYFTAPDTPRPSYTFSHTNSSVTFYVSGLTPGDIVRFYVRRNPDPGWSFVDNFYTAASGSMQQTFTIYSGQSYAINVDVNDVPIQTRYFETSRNRPDNWYWTGISSGSAVSVSASTWNQFCSRINEFRQYKGLSDYSFTAAVSGAPMYASQANEARYAINEIQGHGTIPEAVSNSTVLSAQFMIQLQNALNSIL